MWADWEQASAAAPDENNPILEHHAVDSARFVLATNLYQLKYQREVMKGQPTLAPKMFAMEQAAAPSKGFLIDCTDFRPWVATKTDGGTPTKTSGNGRRRIEAHVREISGVWKVDGLIVQSPGTC